MSDGKGYSSRYLERADYYAEGDRVVGQWQGRSAELLGLSGEVKSEDFEALRQGLDPETGEFLRQRQSADRLRSDGTKQSHAKHLYDFTISAPKSVSVMAILGGDKRLIEAHENAVAEALKELELHAATRVRQDGANTDRATGNLALAVYHHDISRELDPQLHSHAVAANLTFDGTEGRWKALQASGIYERRAYLTEVYRNSLARQVNSLGYDIENRRGAKGRDAGFEIRGVSHELLARYSQRSQQRDEAIEEFTETKGRSPTDNEVAVLVRESRPDKLIEISGDEVRSRQRSRLKKGEADALAELREATAFRPSPREAAEPFLRHAEEHVFERVSVARDYEILTEALRHGRGQIDHSELKGTLALEESSGAILRDGNEIATIASLRREREMIDRVNRGVGRFERLGADHQFVASDRLGPEQKQSVEFILHSRDWAVNLRGAAGTGKTATLQELHRGLDEAGQKVLAIAPTMSAVEELQKVGFGEAMTLERLLHDERAQSALAGAVLLLDEAGMVSGRQMHELLKLTEEQSARIVFSGDTEQIHSVEAGDALRVPENESRLRSTSLSQVHRQASTDYRDAIQELRRDPENGFEKLDRMGAVHEVPVAGRAQAVAQAYVESKSQDVLVVSATHEEIDRITEAIRDTRKQNGSLGESVQVEHDVPLNWTASQKSDARNFVPGQRLTFHRAVKGIVKNESLEVVRSEGKTILARNSQGEEHSVAAKHAKAFEVYDRRTIEVAAGDKLLLTANRRNPDFRATNGEIVTISRVDDRGRIHLDDGRKLPADYKHFTHGYAVTAHRSQGKSVDSVIISGDGMRKELFYVAASRGRNSVQVITSNKDLLRESVARSTARQSASELAQKVRPGLQQGPYRGESSARQLAAHAARQVQPRTPKPAHQVNVAEHSRIGRTDEYSFER
jgi:conjugative relaxase-like TrwC/TraI family protein